MTIVRDIFRMIYSECTMKETALRMQRGLGSFCIGLKTALLKTTSNHRTISNCISCRNIVRINKIRTSPIRSRTERQGMKQIVFSKTHR